MGHEDVQATRNSENADFERAFGGGGAQWCRVALGGSTDIRQPIEDVSTRTFHFLSMRLPFNGLSMRPKTSNRLGLARTS